MATAQLLHHKENDKYKELVKFLEGLLKIKIAAVGQDRIGYFRGESSTGIDGDHDIGENLLGVVVEQREKINEIVKDYYKGEPISEDIDGTGVPFCEL